MAKNLDTDKQRDEARDKMLEYSGISREILSLKEVLRPGKLRVQQERELRKQIAEKEQSWTKIATEIREKYGVETPSDLHEELKNVSINFRNERSRNPEKVDQPPQPKQDEARQNLMEKDDSTREAEKEHAAEVKKLESMREDSESYKAQQAEEEASFQVVQRVNSEMTQSNMRLNEVMENSPQQQSGQTVQPSKPKEKSELNKERAQSKEQGGYQPPKQDSGSSQPKQHDYQKKHGREM